MRFEDFKLDKCADGLLPVIIQDAVSLKVIMLGYMNKAAFENTVSTRVVTFYSRTRQELWLKGETSGNILQLVDMFPDCDNDALLIRVNPMGPVCHRGTETCFDTEEHKGFIRRLSDIIKQIYDEMPERSYTTNLFTAGLERIAQKVGEEATETIIEAISGSKEKFVYETSDLIYHLLVLMQERNVTLDDIEKELSKRHKS